MKYAVVSSVDYEVMDTFETKKEALKAIKEYERFDKEQGNPFNEGYYIEEE